MSMPVGWGIGGLLVVIAAASTGVQTTQPSGAEGEIAALVARLASRSPVARDRAARGLAAYGPAAIPVLERFTGSAKEEVALSTRELMKELEAVFFCGARVRLEVDPPRVRWNEPVTLRVIVENRASYASQVPWELKVVSASQSTSAPAAPADEVGRVLDVADFMVVRGPRGEEIELRVEDIGEDEDVEAAVHERIEGGPVGTVPAGGRVVHELKAFNRAWARYPLLAKGRYEIRFAYQPAWTRSEWIDAGVGKVESEPVVIEVTESAPRAVREASETVAIQVAREGSALVARMRSTWDVPQWINLNFGQNPRIYAQVRWTVSVRGEDVATIFTPSAAKGEPAALDPARFRELSPGETIEIGRIDAAALRAAVRESASRADLSKAELSVRYTAMCSREGIRRATDKGTSARDRALREFAEKLPYHVLTGSPQSESVKWEDVVGESK